VPPLEIIVSIAMPVTYWEPNPNIFVLDTIPPEPTSWWPPSDITVETARPFDPIICVPERIFVERAEPLSVTV
jgi:hypothetical protein